MMSAMIWSRQRTALGAAPMVTVLGIVAALAPERCLRLE
jgi:hypothetical protein